MPPYGVGGDFSRRDWGIPPYGVSINRGMSAGDRLSSLPYFPGGIWKCRPMMLRFPLRRAIDNRPYLITDGISEPCDLLYDCLLKVVHRGVHTCHREHNRENNCADNARH